MLCVKCKKNMAVVFIKKLEAGKQTTEGYCIACAGELGISPLNDMMQQMGMTEEDMENMQDQMSSMMEMLENGEVPPEMEPFMGSLGFADGMNTDGGSTESEKEEKAAQKDKKDKKQAKNGRQRPRMLDTFGTNLNKKAKEGKVDRIIGRDKEIERVVQILNRRAKNNPALIGEPGVGKTAIAEALALKIIEGKVPAKLQDKVIYLVDFAAMVAGTQFRGQFEQRVKSLLDEAKTDGNVVLVIDELHNIVGGAGSDGALSAANILKPALARGEIQIVGATTLAEYRKYIEKDAALERRFQPVMVEEPSAEESIEIIKGIRDYYEKHHHIIITDDVIRQAVLLSKRFIQGRFLPDKAIDVIDEAGSKANLDNEILTQYTILSRKKAEADKELYEVENSGEETVDYEKIANLKSKCCALGEQLSALEPQVKSTVLTAEDVANVIEMWANVPVSKIGLHEGEQLMGLEDAIKKSIIGQDEAASAVAKAIRRKRAGVEGRNKPASFIFVGPTGVGKTELVKVLTKEMFGSEDDLIRLDMTEYSEAHAVSKLIGSPPGYVGYEEAGQLTEKVRRKPYSVILFDEIEKAHSSIYNILLQMLDEGRLTDSQGRVVNFENTVIILTSNAGIGFGNENLGFASAAESEENIANDKLKQIFKPELLNRVDEIVVFKKLKLESFVKISAIIVREVQDALLEKGITLEVSDEALSALAEKGFSEKYGARELRRTVQRTIGDKIADRIVSGEIGFGDVVRADIKDGEFVIE